MQISLNRKHQQTSNFQDMMSQMTSDSRRFRGVVLKGKALKSRSNQCKSRSNQCKNSWKNAYFWRAPGKPMRVAMNTDNSVNNKNVYIFFNCTLIRIC